MPLTRKISLLLVVIVTGLLSCHKESAFKYTPKPEVIIDAKAAAASTIHLVKDTVYILAVNLTRDSGQILQIDAGTLLKVNDLLSITIKPGARMDVSGNQTEPVVITSSAYTGKQGFSANSGNWDGIRIYGNETTASGNLSFLRIEFAGVYSSSLLLSRVNNKTVLKNIEISYSFNRPSFELDGGNCNLSNLVSYAAAGTDFLIENGYRGLMQNILAYRHPFYAFLGTNLAGLYITDTATKPTISNLTVIGPDNTHQLAVNYNTGGQARRGALVTTGSCNFHIRNSAFIDFPLHTYMLDDYNTADSIDKGMSDLTFSFFENADSANIFYLKDGAYPPYNSTDMRDFIMRSYFGNQIIVGRNQFKLADPYNYYEGTPNPMPETGSPLLTGADFNSPLYSDPFFEKVSYRGALGTVNWLQGWTNFIPLQTNYNN